MYERGNAPMCTVLLSGGLFVDVSTFVLLCLFCMCCAAHGKREGRLEKRGEGGKQSLSATSYERCFI